MFILGKQIDRARVGFIEHVQILSSTKRDLAACCGPLNKEFPLKRHLFLDRHEMKTFFNAV